MEIFFIVILVAFLLTVIGTVGYSLFELSPFAHHVDHYRDPLTGKRRFPSPHLETRDEFERRMG